MAQLDVFANPVTRARRAFPLVVVLQSDLAETGRDRIVAPLVLRSKLSGTVERLTPRVAVGGIDYLVLVPRLTTIAADELRDLRGQLAPYRDAIVAALDYLFPGI